MFTLLLLIVGFLALCIIVENELSRWQIKQIIKSQEVEDEEEEEC